MPGVAKFGSMGWMAFLGLILPGEPQELKVYIMNNCLIYR
jgi:hypothetical protein